MPQVSKRSKAGDKEKKTEMVVISDSHFEPIKQKIRAECPNVEISVLASSRDNVGGVLYVRNVPKDLVRRIRISVNYIMVPLDDRPATDIIVVPIPDSDIEDRPSAVGCGGGLSGRKRKRGRIMENIAKVLIADDNNNFREMLSVFLAGEGYNIVEARDGAEVFDKALNEAPDVILLDVMLPSRGGFEICREIKSDKRTRQSNVIMLTVKDNLPDKLTGYVAGAQRYLCKPCSLEDIKECLKAVLRQKRLTQINFSRI